MAGLGVSIGSGDEVGKGVAVAAGAAVTGGRTGVAVASWPPHATISPVQATKLSTATGNHFARKVRTFIPTLQQPKPLLFPVSNRWIFFSLLREVYLNSI